MAEVTASRPDLDSLEKYYRYTAREYGKLIYRTMAPVVRRHLTESKGELTYFQYRVELDRVLSDLALHAIIARPLDYGWHVFAHYCGLWLDGKRSFGGWDTARWGINRSVRGRFMDDVWDGRYREVLGQEYIDEVLGHGLPIVTRTQVLWATASEKFGRIWGRVLPYLGIFSFVYPFWYVAVSISRRGWLLCPPILLLTLLLDAYSLGHAMFQVSLPRYAGAMYVPQLLLALLLLFFASRVAVGYARRLSRHGLGQLAGRIGR